MSSDCETNLDKMCTLPPKDDTINGQWNCHHPDECPEEELDSGQAATIGLSSIDINILTREIKYPVGTLCVFSCVEEIQKEFYLVKTENYKREALIKPVASKQKQFWNFFFHFLHNAMVLCFYGETNN